QARSWRLPALYLLALAAPALTALALSPAPSAPPADTALLREGKTPDSDLARRADADPVRLKVGEAAIPQSCATRRAADAARRAGAGLLAQAAAPCERAATER